MTKITMTFDEWNKHLPEMQDLSHQLPDSFLMFGQVMRGKIRWNKKTYLVSAWRDGRVELQEN